jgi:uncharacterized RmlC-like cupin family protein
LLGQLHGDSSSRFQGEARIFLEGKTSTGADLYQPAQGMSLWRRSAIRVRDRELPMTANDRPVVTKKGSEHDNTAQSGGLKLMTGVGPQHTPATRIWFGKASNPPGFRSLPHHHGEAETGAYLLSGRARIYFGKDYQEYVEMSEGDFMFVPPYLPHLEANMSTTEELWWLACRTPENIVVNLPDVEDALLAGYRRA